MKTKPIFAQKLKQLRLSRGWTLDELVAGIGGIVTKQSLSKYELGLAQPSAPILAKIASVFNMKSIQLLAEPRYKIEFIAYRKRCALRKKEQTRIENLVKESFEERLKIQDIVCPNAILNIPVQKLSINRLEDAEEAADKIRAEWNLGKDQIFSVTGLLENKLVHVLEVDANEKFDGMVAVAYDDGNVRGVAIVVRKGTSGERQRLNLSHEIGHLVLKISKSVDEEKAAFRFGAAFLAPREWMLKEVGSKRTAINFEELIILKQKFGMSIQAILYRLKDLDVISEAYYTQCFRYISRLGWKRQEPCPLSVERAEWLKQNVYKAFAESLLSQNDAETVLKEKVEDKTPISLKTIRSFMKLPMEERRRILSEQAAKAASHYENDHTRDAWQTGEFSE